MEKDSISNSKENEKQYAKKKYLDPNKDKIDFEYDIDIFTNLTHLELNPKAIEGVFLFGCDIEWHNQTSQEQEFNPVNIMRKARKLKCFQEKIKEYVPEYYISGLVLMGRPKNDEKKFKFYLKIKDKDGKIEGEIFNSSSSFSKSNDDDDDGDIYKFKFKRKKKDLSKMKDEENSEIGEAQCVANYLNICLGKILKKCGYTKDRSTRKILYYKKKDAENGKIINNSNFFYFPALKAVCEAYEGGKIFMKILPKKLLYRYETYEDYFYSIKGKDISEVMGIFEKTVLNKRGIKTYDQALIKIEEVIFENPYDIKFKDKDSNEWNVGDYYAQRYKIHLNDEKMPIAVRMIDKGGKLKGKDITYIHIPCCFLQIIGNIFGDNINIKEMVQNPYEKYYDIMDIRDLIEEKAKNAEEKELHNYLGDKYEPVTIKSQIIKPPIIQFDNNHQVDIRNGSIDLMGTSPYSKIKELNKVDVYLLDLESDKGNDIWERLVLASKELGITFNEKPMFYPIKDNFNSDDFHNYIYNYFKKVDEYYSNKENKADFIFMFMDSSKKNSYNYRIFKSVINKFNWSIPTQVILYNENKIRRSNLSQFTNILCQMWAKKGNELYICDFSFVPKTMVIAYSSMSVLKEKVLTSISVSIGTKLYEYMFYSKIEDNSTKDTRISPSLESLLTKALSTIGKTLKKNIRNIVIYRDAVNERQHSSVQAFEIDFIKNAIETANKGLEKKPYSNTNLCLILVSKINEIKMFLKEDNGGNNGQSINNIPVGTIIDKIITHKEKYDFYLNSAESRQGTSASTHYTVLYDDTELSAMQIYKLTYYLTYLSYNTTKSIRVPAPLYFVTRRNKFTSENLKGEVINPKFRTLNISL